MEHKWYDKVLTSNFPTTALGIEVSETSALIGISLLKDIDLLNRSAETAIYIGDLTSRGKGYSKEALAQTLDFGFRKLGLHRIWLKVRADNDKAIGLYKSAGFKLEGSLRDSVFKNGEFKTVMVFSVMSGEYYPRS